MSPDQIVLLFLILITLITAWLSWTRTIGAVFIPTPTKTVRKMLDLAQVNENDVLIDLGSGDGRIIIEAAKTHGAKSIGVEADPLRVLLSRTRVSLGGLQDRVEVVWGNFFKTPIGEATVVTVYQGQDINQRLVSKFMEELEPGTRVVSYSFTFDGWEPVREDTESSVYLYRVCRNSEKD